MIIGHGGYTIAFICAVNHAKHIYHTCTNLLSNKSIISFTAVYSLGRQRICTCIEASKATYFILTLCIRYVQ